MNLNNFIKMFKVDKYFLIGLTLAVFSSLVFIKNFRDFLMQNNYLGKLYIIVLVIFLTCINKYLGLVYVLILIYFLMFSNNSYIENFEAKTDEKKDQEKDKETKINVVVDKTVDGASNEENPVSSSETAVVSKSSETTTKAIEGFDLQSIEKGIEGFDLQSMENSIKRGKQSNSIPVDQIIAQTTNEVINPYEEGKFSENFTII